MKPKAEIEKKIEQLNKIRIEDSKKGVIDWEILQEISKLQALLQQTNEIIKEIDTINTSKYTWTVDEFVEELKSRIEGK